jgi:hypothetical protein
MKDLVKTSLFLDMTQFFFTETQKRNTDFLSESQTGKRIVRMGHSYTLTCNSNTLAWITKSFISIIPRSSAKKTLFFNYRLSKYPAFDCKIIYQVSSLMYTTNCSITLGKK